MKRRPFMLRPPHQIVDYRDDQLLLGALEAEIKLASRFFVIVDFISENIVGEDGKINPEDSNARELMASLGQDHWQRAKKIIKLRQTYDEEYGRLDEQSAAPEAIHDEHLQRHS